MSYKSLETSVDNANPFELYLFTYKQNTYAYTSSQTGYTLFIDNTSYTFNPEYIERGDNLKLGDSSNTQETCIITVSRNNNVALLYQGSPPETDSVSVTIYRIHGDNSSDYSTILNGKISQVHFSNSVAEITINIDSVLKRNIPQGELSYFCQNNIYDVKCKLKDSDYEIRYGVDHIDHLTIKSSTLAGKPDGYYTDGYIKMGNAYRQIATHVGDTITIKYPISSADLEGSFLAYPGCNGLFYTCAVKFSNTDNFSGVPYIQPYDAFKNPTGKGAYWINSEIIRRDTSGGILGS